MIHNERCDNCLCRTVCYFTFPGHELTEKDGKCGHFISTKDIVLPAIKEFAEELKAEFNPEVNYGVVANCAIKLFRNTIDHIVNKKMGEE